MIGKELSKIEEKDLQDLIDNVVLEGKTIEYKAALPGNSDGDKKEFLADVSSFANAGGGDLIFGMTEDPQTKEPKSLDGLVLSTVDQEKARLDNMIREGVEPRMPAVHIHPVSLKNGKTAIVIRVGKSWVSPHRVTYKGHDEFYSRRKFYSRNSTGKYPLDVGELRIAFTMSETITERIRRFREDRIARLYANETPVPTEAGAKMVLHIVPLSSFSQNVNLDIARARTTPSLRIEPIRSAGYSGTFTLDGFVTYTSKGRFEAGAYTYGHLYRNGIIEYVEMSMIDDEPTTIPSTGIEGMVEEAVGKTVALLSSFEVPPPFFIFLTFIGVMGFSLQVPMETFIYADASPHPINTDVLSLPEAVIENYEDSIPKALKLTFDTLWNACGYSGSISYNEKGEWRWGKR